MTTTAFVEDLELAEVVVNPHPGRADSKKQIVKLRKNGRAASEAQLLVANLPQLHAVIGFYARALWDMQQAKSALDNRCYAMRVTDIPEEFVAEIGNHASRLADVEHAIDLHLLRLMRTHPLRGFIESSPGIALGGFGRLLGVTGPLDRFPNVAKLWKYLGLAVMDGQRQRMPKGGLASHTDCAGGHARSCKPDCKTDHHPNCTPGGFGNAYSPRGLAVCHQLGESIEKLTPGNGPYRETYDRRKAECSIRHPDWTPMHLRADARRVAVKALIADLWGAWRDVLGVQNVQDDTRNGRAADLQHLS